MSLEDKLVLISDEENERIKSALDGLDFIEKKPSEALLELDEPSIAVYVSDRQSLNDDNVFNILLSTWKGTYFFVVKASDDSEIFQQKKRKYRNGDAKRISEVRLENISSLSDKTRFKDQVKKKFEEISYGSVPSKDILLFMSEAPEKNGGENPAKKINAILKELYIRRTAVFCQDFQVLESYLLREPAMVVVGQENKEYIPKITKKYDNTLVFVAERKEVEHMKKINGVITLSTQPEDTFKESLSEIIRLVLNVNKKEKKIPVSLDDRSNADNHLYILLGPVCAGKTSIIDTYVENHTDSAVKVITSTTRRRRPDEVNNKDMIFLSKKEFDLRKSIKGVFMLVYSRYEGNSQIQYGIPQTTLNYLEEGDVFIHTKNADIIDELVSSGKIAKDKIVPILITASSEKLSRRILGRDIINGDELNSANLKDKYSKILKEPDAIKKSYLDKVKKHGFLPLHIFNEYEMERSLSILENIVRYHSKYKPRGLTFVDSISKRLFGSTFSELKRFIVNFSIPNSDEFYKFMSKYVPEVISEDERSKFYSLLTNLSLKLSNTEIRGKSGKLDLLIENKNVKELRDIFKAEEMSIIGVLQDLVGNLVDYKVTEASSDSITWAISDSLGKEYDHSIKSLSIYFKLDQ